MEKIIWDESFSVGVKRIDAQHKELIKMINKLIETPDIKVDSELISDLLSRMTDYADYHFKTEEEYMVEYNYPDYSIHKDQHVEFKKQALAFCLGTMAQQETIVTEIFFYLKNWLTTHVLGSDMEYKLFFNEKGLR